MLKDLISQYIEEIRAANIEKFEDRAAEVEKFRVRFLGRKGVMNELFEQFKALPGDQKKEMGIALNELKNAALAKVEEFKNYVEEKMEAEDRHDLTLPADFAQRGSRHVLSVTMNEIAEIFARIGFTVEESVEIEDDWHLFSALNFPPDHPARDMQDTFFVEKEEGKQEIALRTHTSQCRDGYLVQYLRWQGV